jgi:hypothetical protein
MALMVPLMMAYWFAPVLAAWHRLTFGRSLFFSFVACWMNWRPSWSYGAGLFLSPASCPVFCSALLLCLFPGAQFITAIVMVPMG